MTEPAAEPIPDPAYIRRIGQTPYDRPAPCRAHRDGPSLDNVLPVPTQEQLDAMWERTRKRFAHLVKPKAEGDTQ